ncbi:MAG: hypothetical protein WCT23_06520 [Candidatus Neomarinimicrobiota bacterium]|jgi:hypothetical protein
MKSVHVILQDPEIRQRYGGEMGALADELKSAGVTHVIVPILKDGTAYYPSDILPQRWDYGTDLLAFRHSLRKRKIKFVAKIDIFKDEYTYCSQPQKRAVDELSSTKQSEELAGICPSDKQYQNYKLDIIHEVMLIFQADGIYLDHASFPIEKNDINSNMQLEHLRQFCFCPNCINTFAQHAQIELPQNLSAYELNAWILEDHTQAWVSWKTSLLTVFMENAHKIIKNIDPETQIMLNILPWKNGEFNHAWQDLAGQDIKTLASFTDYFILTVSDQIPVMRYDEIRLSIEKEIENNSRVIPTIQLPLNSNKNNEENFKESLRYFKDKLIVSDWSYMLKNRRFLNTFISEHNL